MRTRSLALGAAAVLALAVTACGGSGSSPTTPLTLTSPASSSTSTPNLNQEVFNTSAPTSKVTVSFKLPKAAPANPATRARLMSLYGNQNLRTLGTTSPTAQIRAVGLSSGRNPQFVSGTTFYVELIITDSNNAILSDGVNTCASPNSGTCTAQFNAPIGTNLTASILLYDVNQFLLGAGSSTAVTVVAGANLPLSVTVNPVASYLDVESGAANFINDPSKAQAAFNVTVTPRDADMNAEASPGILLNQQFVQITGYTLTPQTSINGSTITPTAITPTAAMTLTPDPSTLVGTQSYAFSGTGIDPLERWAVVPVALGTNMLPFAPNVAAGPQFSGVTFPTTALNSVSMAYPVTPGLQWTGITPGGASPPPNDNGTFNAAPALAVYTSEFPSLQPTTVSYSLIDNVPGFSGNITISDNGQCIGIISSTVPSEGSPTLYSLIGTNGGVSVTLTPSATGGGCALIATDGFSQTTLNLFFDKTNLTIQSTARKH